MTLDEARMAISDKHASLSDIPKKILNLTKGKFVNITLGSNGIIAANTKFGWHTEKTTELPQYNFHKYRS